MKSHTPIRVWNSTREKFSHENIDSFISIQMCKWFSHNSAIFCWNLNFFLFSQNESVTGNGIQH